MTRPSRFEPGWIHFSILGLSAVLVGIYSMRILPAGIAQVSLQSGILGAIASLGIGLAALARVEQKLTARAEIRVEGRLDRHVDGSVTRIDGDCDTVPPAPNTIAEPARRTVYDSVS
ncbi:MAG: hypothetical protein O2820_11500 [Planctomycetota bacterium]|nr:hypothetical protein [Planctomycetota bacterium]MDA1249834.1 hypothetical protein [Planctomycetota bacterium]